MRRNDFWVIFCIPASVFFLSMSPFKISTQRNNFSGMWVLNTKRSDFGKSPENAAPFQMKIDQKSDSILIERQSNSSNGDVSSYLENMPFNGHAVKSVIASGTTRKSASIKWSFDDQSLIEIGDYINYAARTSYKVTEEWHIADEGKTLIVDRKDEDDRETVLLKCVYERK